jgi:hypothetical protein
MENYEHCYTDLLGEKQTSTTCLLPKGKGKKKKKSDPGLIAGQVMLYLWWIKWHWGRFSPIISVSLSNSHSTDFSALIAIHHEGLVHCAK